MRDRRIEKQTDGTMDLSEYVCQNTTKPAKLFLSSLRLLGVALLFVFLTCSAVAPCHAQATDYSAQPVSYALTMPLSQWESACG